MKLQRQARHDQGFSLLEVILAVVVLSVAGLALLNALQSSLLSVRKMDDKAAAMLSLSSASQILNATPYQSCNLKNTKPYKNLEYTSTDTAYGGYLLPRGVTIESVTGLVPTSADLIAADAGKAGSWISCTEWVQGTGGVPVLALAQRIVIKIEVSPGVDYQRTVLRFYSTSKDIYGGGDGLFVLCATASGSVTKAEFCGAPFVWKTYVVAGASVTLNLTAKNPPGSSSTISYSMVPLMSGPSNATLSGQTVRIDATSPGTYSYEVDAYDYTAAAYAIPIAVQVVVWAPPAITTATLANAAQNKPYSVLMEATGGAGALTWSISAGALPAGLRLNEGSGLISGTPTDGTLTGKVSTFTVTVTDENGTTASKQLTITTYLPPVIVMPSFRTILTEGRTPASVTFTSTGGAQPVTWSATGLSALGMSLSSAGVMSGTPSIGSGTSTGKSYPITVTVTDSLGSTDTATFSLTVYTAPTITAPTNLVGTAGKVLSGITYTATGAPTLTFSASGLPAWASINASSGVISGTAALDSRSTNPSSFSYTVTVTDGNGATATTATQTLKIYAAPTITVPTFKATATEGRAITSATFTGTGAPTLSWSAQGLPAGLSINASTGVLSGTPSSGSGSASGTAYSFTVTLTDGTGNSATTSPLSLKVYTKPSITSGSLQAKATELKAITSVTYAASGGAPNLVWSATGLPSGVTMSSTTGLLSGTPASGSGTSNPTSYSVVVTVTDDNGATDSTSAQSLLVYLKPTITVPSIPTLTEGRPFRTTTTFTSSAATPLTWSATGLPSGVSIDSATGQLSGSPTTGSGLDAGKAYSSVVVTLTDGNGAQASTAALTITVYTPPRITTNPTVQANATETAAIASSTYAATGGAPTRVWSIANQPAGIAINSSTGAVTGTPTAGAGSAGGKAYSLTITVTDGNGATATSTQSMTVYTPPTITNTSLPSGKKGTQYTEKLFASGGYGTLTISVPAGLPAGITFSPNPDKISGTPTKAGTYTVTVKVTDANGASTQVNLTLVIAP